MRNFEELKAGLKDKWLDYYEVNQSWIRVFMTATNSWINTPDSGKRPSSQLILGVATALETQLFMWMSPFCVLSHDSNRIVDALGLNFDPEIELKKREKERELSNSVCATEDPVLQKIRQELQLENLNKLS
ncbi:MAG: hypothetical protein EWV75_20900 [Microcystis wesenbergii Mw_QC_S_20081001_S30D]|jgi:hypothetical protein|uniref:DUF5331 domain-containing protein n=1 Tax=Microcystis wesenbergii Mw_QC_S_20081001_S30D TaxID=2486245 RepID=A0A552J9B9_9CHRO|nr:DUF5331 domain-containing protein [Microcystis aeruginosa W11-03]NCR92999.1 DUF5331 domain-containing protein [Microcystis aeruginosa W11-06]TRU92295.1 MAG: hypothetical protein EWV75_20900 [Microcystis wesenbergii Mw_QC_S_20081001_S30D]TRV02031.1 MAG: hypothetical protein EWV73_08055 [Microcystis wesenbergii Mw_QC_B_20070930_S4D]TRV05788.1 MAG: hypothetical protein EWV74_02290 [Microcystis wesenbergii Mw_QC_S_20081001_S30]TRV13687.1 MAG: hypothetical protein EWV89_10795 [Microcystis wesenb